MQQPFEKIILEKHFDDQLWRIVLNSPKGNILDTQMMMEIGKVLQEAGWNRHLKLILFEGGGKHFSFGASVEEHRRDRAAAMLEQFHGLFYKMIDLGVPVAALVRGQCLGGGMELVLYCDFVFAESTAIFGQPEINLAVFPPPASVILPLKVGQAVADMIILTGTSIDARKALDYKIASYAVPEGVDGWEFVQSWAKETILPKSASSLRIARKSARMQFDARIKEMLPRLQDDYLGRLMTTHDASEGIEAFLEKRKPHYLDE